MKKIIKEAIIISLIISAVSIIIGYFLNKDNDFEDFDDDLDDFEDDLDDEEDIPVSSDDSESEE